MGVTLETNGIGVYSLIKYLSSNFKDDPDNRTYLNLANNWYQSIYTLESEF